MGLAVRIIPTLLAKGDKLVKGSQFNPWRTVGVVEQAAKICGLRGVDEIILLDVEATAKGQGPDLERVTRISANFFTPLTVGGGIRNKEDALALMRAGADKVSIGTAHHVVREVAEAVGRQAVVVAIDVKHRLARLQGGTVPVFTSLIEHAQHMEKMGAGEILLTSIEREGTQQGYDINLIRAVAKSVSIPVIAHGGCSGPEDMLRAIEAGASAVAAGALFQFTNTTPLDCAEWLAQRGVETRVPA